MTEAATTLNPKTGSSNTRPAISFPPAASRTAWAAGLLLVVVLGVFLPAIRNGFINYDDQLYITENPMVQQGLTFEGFAWAFSTNKGGNWHPLTWLSHMLDWQLFGLNATGHHFTSVLLHALSATMAFLALRRLSGSFWTSLATAALFGLHPLRVESVAWAAERKDTLSTLFWMLALWAYAWWAPRGDALPAADRRRFFWASLACFGLGLMSKPMLVTFPCALLLVDFWPLRRPFAGGGWIRLIWEKIPFLLLTLAACVVTFFAQQKAGATVMLSVETSDRVGNALVSYVRYLGKFFYPADLAVLYPHPGHWPIAGVAGAVVLLLVITTMAWRLRNDRPHLLVGWLWFLGTLVPTIGLVQVGSQAMADRYTYVPSLGLTVMVVWELAHWCRNNPDRRKWVVVGMAGLGFPACVALTVRQISFWKNPETLFRHDLAVVGETYEAHLNIGAYHGFKGEVEPAIAEYEKALQIAPVLFKYLPHFSLGSALLAGARPLEAVPHFEAGLKRAPSDARARFLYAVALSRCERLSEAISQYEEVLRLEPERITAYNNLGILFARTGRPQDALAQFRRAVELQPNYAETHNNAGMLLADQGKWDEAIASYREALRIRPDYSLARQNLEAALRKQAR